MYCVLYVVPRVRERKIKIVSTEKNIIKTVKNDGRQTRSDRQTVARQWTQTVRRQRLERRSRILV